MNRKVGDEVARAFDLAALRRDAAERLTGKEWAEQQRIKMVFDGKRQAETRLFQLDYRTRVEVVRRRLINEAGSKTRNFNHPWFGRDKFDKSALTLQARRVVHHQQSQLMANIDRQEKQSLEALMARSEYRTRLREKPKRDFERATDRRSGPDRRQPRTRQRER